MGARKRFPGRNRSSRGGLSTARDAVASSPAEEGQRGLGRHRPAPPPPYCLSLEGMDGPGHCSEDRKASVNVPRYYRYPPGSFVPLTWLTTAGDKAGFLHGATSPSARKRKLVTSRGTPSRPEEGGQTVLPQPAAFRPEGQSTHTSRS